MTRRFHVEDYEALNGLKGQSFSVDINQLAEFPDPSLDYHASVERPWVEVKPNEYLRGPRNLEDARNLVENFVFPAKAKSTARLMATELTYAIKDVAKMHVERDQVSGRIDRRKLSKLVSTSLSGTYSAETVRPYRRTVSSPVESPVIAIVASGGISELRGSPTYAQYITTLTLGILWACEAANVTAKAAIMQTANVVRKFGYSEAMTAMLLADGKRTFSLRSYAALLHADMYRAAIVSNRWADPESIQQLVTVQGMHSKVAGECWVSSNGGNAVNWAREVLQADMVIAIGNITDKQNADVYLPTSISLQDAVKSIARQAAKL